MKGKGIRMRSCCGGPGDENWKGGRRRDQFENGEGGEGLEIGKRGCDGGREGSKTSGDGGRICYVTDLEIHSGGWLRRKNGNMAGVLRRVIS